jgi:hypothetical protein
LGGTAAGSGHGSNEEAREEGYPSSTPKKNSTSSSSPWNYHEYYHSVQANAAAVDKHRANDHDAEEEGGDVEKEEDDNYTPIIVRGDPVGCFAAIRQILPLVDHAHDPHIVLEVPVHRSKHGLLLGARGVVLALLSATFNVRIMIPPSNQDLMMMGGENHWQPQNAMYGGTVNHDVRSTMLFLMQTPFTAILSPKKRLHTNPRQQ